MLDEMVTRLIGEYNFQRHLARYNGRLLSALGDKIRKPTGIWEGYPYHKLYFTCNDRGFLCKLGALQDFSEKEIETHTLGRFRIAVDQAQVNATGKADFTNTDFPNELIIDIGLYKKEVPRKIIDRIREATAFYNEEFGFVPNYNSSYNGFTAGNVLDNK